MAKLGRFDRAGQAHGDDAFRGELWLAHGVLPVVIVRDPDATGDNRENHFDVKSKGAGGVWFPGRAFRSTIKRGENQGQMMFGLLLDHPDVLPPGVDEIRGVAFPHPDGGFLVRTDRSRGADAGGQSGKDAATSPAHDPKTGEVSDEIPF